MTLVLHAVAEPGRESRSLRQPPEGVALGAAPGVVRRGVAGLPSARPYWIPSRGVHGHTYEPARTPRVAETGHSCARARARARAHVCVNMYERTQDV